MQQMILVSISLNPKAKDYNEAGNNNREEQLFHHNNTV
jgi:hypothetical protein